MGDDYDKFKKKFKYGRSKRLRVGGTQVQDK